MTARWRTNRRKTAKGVWRLPIADCGLPISESSFRDCLTYRSSLRVEWLDYDQLLRVRLQSAIGIRKSAILQAGGMLGPPESDSTSSGLIVVESLAVDVPAGRSARVVPVSSRPGSFPSSSFMSSPFSYTGRMCRSRSTFVSHCLLLLVDTLTCRANCRSNQAVSAPFCQSDAPDDDPETDNWQSAMPVLQFGGKATFARPCSNNNGNGSRWRSG